MDQFDDRARSDLVHDPTAMDLDGLLADPELASDRPVGLTARHVDQHLALAPGEARDAAPGVLCSRARPSPFGLPGQPAHHRSQELIGVERLLQEIDRSGLHRRDTSVNISVSCDEHHGDELATLVEVAEDLQTIHSRQREIEHQASRAS